MLTILTAATYAVAGTSWGAIIYRVNDPVGAGSVTGFIQTDGTLGVLSQAHVTDWNLLLNTGISTFDLLGPGSGNNSGFGTSGTAFTATVNALFFNFSSVDGSYVVVRNPAVGSAFNYLCLNDTLGQCSSQPSDLVVRASSNEQVMAERGIVQVAAVTVPEPASMALLVIGLIGLRLSRRRG